MADTTHKSVPTNWVHSVSFREVSGLKHLLHCWTVARKSLVSSHYGLTESRFLPREYLKLSSHRYFEAVHGEQAIGIVRVIPRIAMDRYTANLTPKLLCLVTNGFRFDDVGFYYTKEVPREARARIIREAVSFCKDRAAAEGTTGLYIQVPENHVPFYERLGFQIAGARFRPPGWEKDYVPLYLLA